MKKNNFQGGYMTAIMMLLVVGVVVFLLVQNPEILSKLLGKSTLEQKETQTSETKTEGGVTQGNYFQRAFHAVDDAKEVRGEMEAKYKVHEELLNEQ